MQSLRYRHQPDVVVIEENGGYYTECSNFGAVCQSYRLSPLTTCINLLSMRLHTPVAIRSGGIVKIRGVYSAKDIVDAVTGF